MGNADQPYQQGQLDLRKNVGCCNGSLLRVWTGGLDDDNDVANTEIFLEYFLSNNIRTGLGFPVVADGMKIRT